MLKRNLENESVWADSYAVALSVKRELQDKLKVLGNPEFVDGLKKRLSRIATRRARLRRRKLDLMEDRRMDEERRAEKEAAIDKWRLKRILEVEERKRVSESGRSENKN